MFLRSPVLELSGCFGCKNFGGGTHGQCSRENRDAHSGRASSEACGAGVSPARAAGTAAPQNLGGGSLGQVPKRQWWRAVNDPPTTFRYCRGLAPTVGGSFRARHHSSTDSPRRSVSLTQPETHVSNIKYPTAALWCGRLARMCSRDGRTTKPRTVHNQENCPRTAAASGRVNRTCRLRCFCDCLPMT